MFLLITFGIMLMMSVIVCALFIYDSIVNKGVLSQVESSLIQLNFGLMLIYTAFMFFLFIYSAVTYKP